MGIMQKALETYDAMQALAGIYEEGKEPLAPIGHITYDVNTTSPEGKRRLRQVSKKCVAYGTRVQNSVFECILDNTQYKQLKHELCDIIDPSKDSLRFYSLGNNHQNKVVHIGTKTTYDMEGDLIL